MTTKRIWIALGIAAISAGCVPSLHPLYTKKDVVFDPALVGNWGEKDESNKDHMWNFEKGNDNDYVLTLKEDTGPTTFTVHLVKLEKYQFLDIYPQTQSEKAQTFCSYHFLPVHTFYRVWLEGDHLRFSGLNPKWLGEMIEQRKVNITLEQWDNGALLNASTEDLQKLVVQYADDEKAFPTAKVQDDFFQDLYRNK